MKKAQISFWGYILILFLRLQKLLANLKEEHRAVSYSFPKTASAFQNASVNIINKPRMGFLVADTHGVKADDAAGHERNNDTVAF